MSATVYVLNKEGKPLMPTIRCGHVRLLLKTKKAKVVNKNPFTIQLNYEVDNKTQDIILGIDSGRTNIGITAVKENGETVFSAEMESRNKEVTRGMKERKAHRIASRRGRRLTRQRRAIKVNTIFESKERYLPHYEKPITVKYIKNKEAKYCNRKRPKGWLTPTVNHCVLTHINVIKKILKFLPITKISIEVNTFDFQLLENPHIKAWEYTKGKLFGYKNVNEFIREYQNNKCLLCDNSIEHYHHIIPRRNGGSNGSDNLVGLCFQCHNRVHTNEKVNNKVKEIKAGLVKKYSGSSVLNAAMPFIIAEIKKLGLDIWLTTGRRTKAFRDKYKIAKKHYSDAYCIACDNMVNPKISVWDKVYKIKQYRRHDRGYIHKANYGRKYYLDNVLVAINRHKALEQKEDSLEEYRNKLIEEIGIKEAKKIISKLICKEHKSVIKDINRVMPGALIESKGKIFNLKGTNGKHNNVINYYVSEEGIKYRYKTCSVVRRNEGIIILQGMKE